MEILAGNLAQGWGMEGTGTCGGGGCARPHPGMSGPPGLLEEGCRPASSSQERIRTTSPRQALRGGRGIALLCFSTRRAWSWLGPIHLSQRGRFPPKGSLAVGFFCRVLHPEPSLAWDDPSTPSSSPHPAAGAEARSELVTPAVLRKSSPAWWV